MMGLLFTGSYGIQLSEETNLILKPLVEISKISIIEHKEEILNQFKRSIDV